MTVRVVNRMQQRLEDFARQLSGTWAIEITLPARGGQGPTNADLVEYLKDGDRDFLAVTNEMRTAAIRVFKRSAVALIRHHRADLTPAFDGIGEGVLSHIVQRFRRSGSAGPPDVPMRALSTEYARRKGHSRIGVLSGRLRLAFGDARVQTRRR